MTKFLLAIAVLFIVPAAAFSQTDAETKNRSFTRLLKKAGAWSDSDRSIKFREAKIEACVLSYETSTRSLRSGRLAPGDMRADFKSETDVDAAVDASKAIVTTKTVSFDLSVVDLDGVLIEAGYAPGTSFLRIPLLGSEAKVNAKGIYGNDALAYDDTTRPTLVVRADDADELKRLLIDAVQRCKN